MAGGHPGEGGGYKDLDASIEALLGTAPLPEGDVRALCDKAREILVQESNVQPVRCPVTVGFSKPEPAWAFTEW